MRVAVILLACVAHLASAQFQEPPSGLQHRGQLSPIPIRTTRYQRPQQGGRPGPPVQSVLASQRLRKPITFRPRGPGSDDGGNPFSPSRPIRPSLPSGPSPVFQHQVKPVNEEVDEDDRREPSRDREEEDSSSQDHEEEEDESEENVGRPNIPNVPANPGYPRAGSSSSGAPSIQSQQPAPVQYRPPSGTAGPTGRGGTAAPPPIQYRPAPKPTKPRKPPVEEPFKQQVKAPVVKPVKPSHVYDVRGKKPVAQIIRRYRNDNEDGSITWGFENDDGSYKEELIGVDCITRGKYGYVDPDGVRREYTYETGIKCDEEQREEDEENGFVDYQENKLVLPDGKTIDLSSMGKKQTRRPRPY